MVHIKRDLVDNQHDQQDDSPSICNPAVDENQPGRGDNGAQGDLKTVIQPSEDPANEDIRGIGRTQQAPVVHIKRDLVDNQPDHDSPTICNPAVDENQPGRGDNEAEGDLTPVIQPSQDDAPKEDDVMQPFNQENDSPLDLSLTSSVALPITPNIQKSGHDTAGHCSIIITKKDPIPPRKPPSTTNLTTHPRKSSSTTSPIKKNAEKSKKKLLAKRKANKILSPR